jgi:peptide chain release factor 1
MRVLRAKLMELARSRSGPRWPRPAKVRWALADRSERIRTYNFPQGRVTDHRIGLTLHKLDFILNGDLDEMIDALITADQSERLKQVD